MFSSTCAIFLNITSPGSQLSRRRLIGWPPGGPSVSLPASCISTPPCSTMAGRVDASGPATLARHCMVFRVDSIASGLWPFLHTQGQISLSVLLFNMMTFHCHNATATLIKMIVLHNTATCCIFVVLVACIVQSFWVQKIKSKCTNSTCVDTCVILVLMARYDDLVFNSWHYQELFRLCEII